MIFPEAIRQLLLLQNHDPVLNNYLGQYAANYSVSESRRLAELLAATAAFGKGNGNFMQ